MQGVIIVNENDVACEYDENLRVGMIYEKKVNSTIDGVIYAFVQNETKDGWIFSGYATIDAEALIEGLTADEMEKAVLSAKRIEIQSMIRGKSTQGKMAMLKNTVSEYQALYAEFSADDIDAETFATRFAELKK